jgi:multicomponent Na+:H+ antiporter subunit D
MFQQSPILIIVIPLIFAFLTFLFGLWRKGVCYPITLVAVSLSFLASLSTLMTVIATGTIHYRLGSWAPPWGIEYVIDHLNAFVLVIVSMVSLIVAISMYFWKSHHLQDMPL